ncbi:MAG: hypothetical protein B6242_14175 [Anaerolineaceae bacterium 4572_78]|nr:MAG: hypothetical protein B6242_14175 [Anaerolineaceae bacterium 4572_78]
MHKKFITLVIVFGLFLTTSLIYAQSSTNQTMTIITNGLNVRSGVGMDYPIMDVLLQNQTVAIIGHDTATGWWHVQLDDGRAGWVSGWHEYVRVDGEVPPLNPPRSQGGDELPLSSPRSQEGDEMIVFQTVSGGAIYAIEPSGYNFRHVTYGIDPALSHDGRSLAFTRWDGAEIGTVWVHDLATGTERLIASGMYEPKSPTWSPDGRYVIISFQQGGNREILHLCVTPGHRLPPRAYDIEFSNGKICYKVPAHTQWKLKKIDLVTGATQDLASAEYSFAPTWDSVNSWRVIFSADTGLQQLDVNQNQYWALTTDLRDHAPVMSPNGNYVAVTYRQHDYWEVYTINTENGNRNRLTKPPNLLLGEHYNSVSPAWSPDGSQIAFVTDRNGRWEIWLMNADGSNQHAMFSEKINSHILLDYHGMDERMLSWR